jgi:hypothetical protein
MMQATVSHQRPEETAAKSVGVLFLQPLELIQHSDECCKEGTAPSTSSCATVQPLATRELRAAKKLDQRR